MSARLEDRFQLLRRIGGGSGGEVYAVREFATGLVKALKVMNAQNAAIPGAEMRFRNECTGLEHEFLVRVDEVACLSGNLCLVMELLDGDSLEAIIRERWNLSVEEKIRLMAQVCRGLACAHRHGRVHRDIKPSNIIRQRKTGTPKIIDFGVAKKIGERGPTVQGTVVGTFAYMSPEQVQGLEVDGRSDIFSAAVVLYELLSGICPFDSDGEFQTKEKIVRGPTPRLPVNLEGIPGPLYEILKKALEKEPSARYQSADEMAEALEACGVRSGIETVDVAHNTEKATTEPKPLEPRQQPLKPTPRRKTKGLGGTLVALFLLAATVAGVYLVVRPDAGKPVSPAQLYRKGMAKKQAGDLSSAIDLWSRACANNIAAACTEAGLAKAHGLAGYVDNSWAATFFDRACSLRHAWGCTNLGALYEQGLGVDLSRARALSLYRKGCTSGDPMGCSLAQQLTAPKTPAGKRLLPPRTTPQTKPAEEQGSGFTLPKIPWDKLPWNSSSGNQK